jgi:hypothetical protein
VIVYLVAIALWVAAIVTLGVSTAGFLRSTGLLIVSAVLSGLAVMAAVGALVVARRR